LIIYRIRKGGNSTLTKIKIIGNPGKQPVGILKIWLKEALIKFDLSLKEIWVVFFTRGLELEEILSRYGKGYEVLPPQVSSVWIEEF
jgi:hypothetical protein